MDHPATPADYIANIGLLVNMLQQRLGSQFIRVVLRTRLGQEAVEFDSDTFFVSPIAEYVPHHPRFNAQIIVHAFDQGDLLRPPHPWELTYWIDGITANKWSTRSCRQTMNAWIRNIRAKKCLREAERRIAPIKEELMAAAWSPERVERLLEAGDYNALE